MRGLGTDVAFNMNIFGFRRKPNKNRLMLKQQFP